MTSITQDMKYRLSLIRYTEKYGVTKAAIKYKTNRQYIYRWKRRFDGSIESLRDRSRRPYKCQDKYAQKFSYKYVQFILLSILSRFLGKGAEADKIFLLL